MGATCGKKMVDNSEEYDVDDVNDAIFADMQEFYTKSTLEGRRVRRLCDWWMKNPGKSQLEVNFLIDTNTPNPFVAISQTLP